MEVGVDVVARIDILDEDIETRQRQLEAKSLIASGERDGLLDHVTALERSNMRLRDTLRMESVRANRLRRCMSFMEDELRQIYRFCYYDRLRFRRLETFSMRRLEHDYHSLWYDPEAIKELIAQRAVKALATYKANCATELVVKSQRQNGDDGNGNGNPNRNDRGAMPVTRECTYHDFMKCQPLNFKGTKGFFRLTRTVGADSAFAMSWKELMKLIIEVYCLRNEIQKMETELWNLTAKEPTRLQDAIQISNNLMDQKLKGYAAKTGNNANKARGKAYVLGGGEANPDSNIVTGMFLFNNHYASMLFDSGADRSFVSTTFSALLYVVPSTLDISYAVELADRRVAETNTVLRGCTLGLLSHPFNIDLMPIKHGSFDVIISMD
ncbi:putative reverse transcriptase domain-containing protein [Tanacetum coccineum]